MENENYYVNLPTKADTIISNVDVYDRINDPMTAVKTLGMSIYKSGLFSIDRAEQGEILAMECLKQKMSPLELARTYHFFDGKLVIRADALLAKFQMIGGSVQWLERTDKVVKARFSCKGNSAEITMTIDEFIGNKIAIGKDGKLKTNWEKWPRRMLTARAISEGTRLIAPECCFGTYVAEEMDGVEKSSYKPSQAEGKGIYDLIPEDKRDAAIRHFKNSGYLKADENLDNLPWGVIQTYNHSPSLLKSLLDNLK